MQAVGSRTTSGTYRKIMTTRASNAQAAIAAARRRITDPLENAKLILRRAGYNTYAESVKDGKHKSKLIVCGSHRMAEDELIEFAAEVQHRRENPCRMTA